MPARDDDVTLDRLSGEWWIYQLRSGHRYATDDVLVAWTAHRAFPRAGSLLDLGAGVGSVGLMTLQLLPPEARLTSVELLEISVALARRTMSHNRLEERVEVRRGDLRTGSVIGPEERFDLITANPPYLPLDRGSPPSHPQRRAARFELRGTIVDYCRVAARHLGPQGRFCFCYPAGDPRASEAMEAAGLVPLSRQPVVFREAKPPHLCLYVCAAEGECWELPELCVRGADGSRTSESLQVLRDVAIAE